MKEMEEGREERIQGWVMNGRVKKEGWLGNDYG
jgi:hypothetical protein